MKYANCEIFQNKADALEKMPAFLGNVCIYQSQREKIAEASVFSKCKNSKYKNVYFGHSVRRSKYS